jgi:hypothetical protein
MVLLAALLFPLDAEQFDGSHKAMPCCDKRKR